MPIFQRSTPQYLKKPDGTNDKTRVRFRYRVMTDDMQTMLQSGHVVLPKDFADPTAEFTTNAQVGAAVQAFTTRELNAIAQAQADAAAEAAEIADLQTV